MMAPTSGAAPLRVAYLINQYPKVSHSFIRREILALERQGVEVVRLAIRGWKDHVVDPQDRSERQRTRYVLEAGAGGLASALAGCLVSTPRAFLAAAARAWSLWRRSGGAVRHAAYLAEACWIVRHLRHERVAHLHAHFGTNPAEVAMLVRLLGGPDYSFTVHGPEEFDHPVSLGLDEKAARARHVVAISSFGRSQLYRWLHPRDWGKVEVVHCGLEPTFHDVPESAPAGAVPSFVCVGRLCEQKGQLLLVEALAQVRARGLDVRLVLAGDGEMRAAIEARIAELGLGGAVRITGWISSDDVRREILAARALVLPSFAEGLPVVLMEAMALRRPVVTTYVAGIPELVEHGVSGWLVPAGDVDALVVALCEAHAADASRLAEMGRSARERALQRHDIDRSAVQLRRLFSGGAPAAVVAVEH